MPRPLRKKTRQEKKKEEKKTEAENTFHSSQCSYRFNQWRLFVDIRNQASCVRRERSPQIIKYQLRAREGRKENKPLKMNSLPNRLTTQTQLIYPGPVTAFLVSLGAPHSPSSSHLHLKHLTLNDSSLLTDHISTSIKLKVLVNDCMNIFILLYWFKANSSDECLRWWLRWCSWEFWVGTSR